MVKIDIPMPQSWQLAAIIATHIVVDAMKARWNLISYAVDQLLHIAVFAMYFLQ